MRRVEVRIAELVVTGPDAGSARAVVDAIEQELRARLEHAVPGRVAAAGDRRDVRAPDARLRRGTRPEEAGAVIAARVGGALGWW